MRSKLEKITLIFIGTFLGILVSFNLPVFADKTKSPNLPIEDLRTFAEVFGKIKTDYQVNHSTLKRFLISELKK